MTARKPSARTLKTKATTLHSKLVRTAGRCERCRSVTGQLHCAHIVGRRYAATRTDENNAWCLCSSCHRYLTENPHEHVRFAVQTRGEDGYDALIQKAYASVGLVMKAAFWQSEVDRLSPLLTAALEGCDG